MCLALVCPPTSALALELAFPGTAELIASTDPVDGQHTIATGPWSAAGLPTRMATGVVQELTWHITGDGVTTMGLLASLRDQIEAQGFTVSFTCFASACGGFDFRHALPVGTAPEMHVDLGDFHYLSAMSEDGETEAALMISRGGAMGFVHLALIRPPSEASPPVIQSTRTPDPVTVPDEMPPDDLIAQLTAMGSAPLDDLQFETGASQLSGERYASLLALAAFLAEDPSRTIVLVGHTDVLGSLAGNIALSRARAQAVQQFLTQELGVSPTQVEAQGIGFLAPRAANTTEEGREANRRVEVVLTAP
ncbi:OmpA family protein [Gymnodinialimonas sp.]